jgi:oligopeptide/dipeptide ABC transporter ATP-binding protein
MTGVETLLRIQGLTVSFPGQQAPVTVLDNVSFEVFDKEIVGLVGESGSGKTMSSLSVMRFLPPSGRIEAGEIWFRNRNLVDCSEAEMRQIRGRQIAMIFQSTRSALNPLMRVGDQVARVYRIQRGLGGREAQQQAVAALKRMGIPDAERRAKAYPHQLSRGMCQRVLIAMMVACEPALLIADEPTTGLDVTIQAQIFELIKAVQQATEASILLITHDLGVVAETCERVVVMYAGQVMETAPVAGLFASPRHPYTQRLLGSVLRVDKVIEMPKVDAGLTEDVAYSIAGCRFASRCPRALPRCWENTPLGRQLEADHWVMCHDYE